MSEIEESKYPAVAIVGPTASGKSALGVALAQRFRGEIVTCDALQVYRNMDIGTAKPTAAECGGIPHHMLDLRDPCETFSAGDYQREGREVLRAIRARGRIPMVVGGTGFYLRTLIDGLFEGPGRSVDLRARMRAIVARRGPEIIHKLLYRVDPETAARLAAADTDRNIRAYEIYLQSGQTMSWWQGRPKQRVQGFTWLKLGIFWPREELYARIDRRVMDMFQGGLIDEVRRLLEAFPENCHAFKAIGYRQVAEYLRGECGLEEAIADTQRESRRYAKRQQTWFRSDPDIVWLEATSGPDLMFEHACRAVQHWV